MLESMIEKRGGGEVGFGGYSQVDELGSIYVGFDVFKG